MIAVTRGTLVAAYELLRTTQPFLSWKLPDSGEVEFVVLRAKDRQGDCDDDTIRIAHHYHGLLPTLLATMAHEMIHLYQIRNGLAARSGGHNDDFHKRAARVCRTHGFDPKVFT